MMNNKNLPVVIKSLIPSQKRRKKDHVVLKRPRFFFFYLLKLTFVYLIPKKICFLTNFLFDLFVSRFLNVYLNWKLKNWPKSFFFKFISLFIKLSLIFSCLLFIYVILKLFYFTFKYFFLILVLKIYFSFNFTFLIFRTLELFCFLFICKFLILIETFLSIIVFVVSKLFRKVVLILFEICLIFYYRPRVLFYFYIEKIYYFILIDVIDYLLIYYREFIWGLRIFSYLCRYKKALFLASPPAKYSLRFWLTKLYFFIKIHFILMKLHKFFGLPFDNFTKLTFFRIYFAFVTFGFVTGFLFINYFFGDSSITIDYFFKSPTEESIGLHVGYLKFFWVLYILGFLMLLIYLFLYWRDSFILFFKKFYYKLKLNFIFFFYFFSLDLFLKKISKIKLWKIRIR